VSLGTPLVSCKTCPAPHSCVARSASPFAPATQANPSKAFWTSGFRPVSYAREAFSVEIGSPAQIVLEQRDPTQVTKTKSDVSSGS
jgi:hypothetical protein